MGTGKRSALLVSNNKAEDESKAFFRRDRN